MKDERVDRKYAPSIQPYLLKKWVRSGRITGPAMLVDSDIMLKQFSRFPVCADREIWGSDVGGYINSSYLDGTDPHLLSHLARIAGIPAEYVRQHKVAIGAQYILPQLFDYQFWDEIEAVSNTMYALMTGYKCAVHEVQIWTASMWAMLYAFYRLEIEQGYQVKTSPSLGFAWGTDPIERWNDVDILHMAGVTQTMQKQGYFFKGAYTDRTPFGDDFGSLARNNCSWIYARAIKRYSEVRKEIGHA